MISGKKTSRNTREKIVKAAWKLFYKQGFEDTTIEEIVYESQTSKGSFYHYFKCKEELLNSLSYLFDQKYEELMDTFSPDMDFMDKLMYLNRELFEMIDNEVSLDLLSRLYASQLVSTQRSHLLDYNRTYYKLINRITQEGREKGELAAGVSVNEFVKLYALCERAFIYDWCLSGGAYSLRAYSEKLLPEFLAGYRADGKKGIDK